MAKKSSFGSLIIWIFFWFSILIGLTYYIDWVIQVNSELEKQGFPNPINKVGLHINPKPEDFQINVAGGLILKRDYSGHFMGITYLNGIKADFIIDTGATFTTIPKEVAIASGLSIERDVELSTANGVIVGHLTQVDQMILGSAEFQQIDAIIADRLNVVLIGMNVLKHFTMTVEDDTMTLVMKGQTAISEDQSQLFEHQSQPIYLTPPQSVPMPVRQGSSSTSVPTAIVDKTIHKSWKKTLACDEEQHCVQSYTEE